MTDWIGKRIGKYKINELLGRGGMAEVYKGFHPDLERDVAIKMIHPHLADDPGFVDRFRREARTAAALRHPNIVTVHAVGEENGTHYLAYLSTARAKLGLRPAGYGVCQVADYHDIIRIKLECEGMRG